MHRGRRVTLVAVLLVLAILVSCSKKSGTPTAPQPADPTCSLSTTSLNFGTVTVGMSADRQFT
jgi:hypothetical protein